MRALSVAAWADVLMGAALFDDGRWHSLIAVNDERLSDYPYGCTTEESARLCCYTGLHIFLSIKGITLPPLEELAWDAATDADKWIEAFYRLPVWQP